jgi:hypothetical protein
MCKLSLRQECPALLLRIRVIKSRTTERRLAAAFRTGRDEIHEKFGTRTSPSPAEESVGYHPKVEGAREAKSDLRGLRETAPNRTTIIRAQPKLRGSPPAQLRVVKLYLETHSFCEIARRTGNKLYFPDQLQTASATNPAESVLEPRVRAQTRFFC